MRERGSTKLVVVVVKEVSKSLWLELLLLLLCVVSHWRLLYTYRERESIQSRRRYKNERKKK